MKCRYSHSQTVYTVLRIVSVLSMTPQTKSIGASRRGRLTASRRLRGHAPQHSCVLPPVACIYTIYVLVHSLPVSLLTARYNYSARRCLHLAVKIPSHNGIASPLGHNANGNYKEMHNKLTPLCQCTWLTGANTTLIQYYLAQNSTVTP